MIQHVQSSLTAIGIDALRLCAATALSSLPIGYLTIVLPIYFNKVGLDSTLIGQLYAISSVTSAVLMIVFGLLADRIGRKPFVVLGWGLPAISYSIFLNTSDSLWLTLAAGIGGVGLAGGLSGALGGSSFNALLAEKSSDANRTLVFSLGSIAWTGALMAGSLISGLPEWLQAHGWSVLDSYHPLFWLSLVSTLLAVLILLPIREGHQSVTHSWRDWLPRRSLSAIAKLSLVMGLIGLGLGFSVQLLSLWFYLKFNVSGDVLGPWYAASEGLSTVALVLVPRLARRIGTANTVLVTQVSAALFLMSMIVAPTATIAAALYLVRNFLMNLAWPAQQSYIMGVVDPRERATGSSVVNAMWGLANSISPAISGVWLDQRLLALPLLASGASYLLSVATFYGLFRKVRLPEEAGAPLSETMRQPELAQSEI